MIESLLEPDEPAPVLLERAGSDSPFLLVADHGDRRFPRATGSLGLPPAELDRHIAYDIGILPVARGLAEMLDAPLVAQTYSRLLIDCNRPIHVPQSIPEISEMTEIPGNRGLADSDRQARMQALFRPYHGAIATLLDARADARRPTVLIALHSFTPVYMGAARPWHVGLLYNRDGRLARPLLELLMADAALTVGDQLPYAVDDEHDYTLPVHGEQRGLLHVGVEIRQDLIAETAGQEQWTERLGALLKELLGRLPPGDLRGSIGPARRFACPWPRCYPPRA